MIFIHMYLGYVLIMFLILSSFKTVGDNRHAFSRLTPPPESVSSMKWKHVFLFPVISPILLPVLVGVALYASFAKEPTEDNNPT